MVYLKEAFECSVQELDKELVARCAQTPQNEIFQKTDTVGLPQHKEIITKAKNFFYKQKNLLKPDPELDHISTRELTKVLLYKTGRIEIGGVRGVHGKDDRQDLYNIEDKHVIQNAKSVAALCSADDLIDAGNGMMSLRVRKYARVYGLCKCEPFFNQPVGAGITMTGCLVEDDVIATAYHCIKKFPKDKLRIIFGYKMSNSKTPVTQIHTDNIYKPLFTRGDEYKSRNIRSPEWALIKLDRKVIQREPVQLSSKNNVTTGQQVYVLGHPVGLPLKFAPGAKIQHIQRGTFVADLDIYSGNSGSPIFDAESHEFIGVVTKGDYSDFVDTGECVISIVYPNREFCKKGPRGTQLEMFRHHLSV